MRATFLGKTTEWMEYPVQKCADNPVVVDTLVWHFSAIVLDGDTAKVWLDGEILCEDIVAITPEGFQWADSSENVVGKSHWPDATFNGMIDAK